MERDDLGVDLRQLARHPLPQGGVRPGSVPVAPGVQEPGDLVELEPQPLRRLDDPQSRDRVGRVHAMPAGGPAGLLEEPASLVVAQGLEVDPGGRGDLAAAQRSVHADRPEVALAEVARAASSSSTRTR